MDPRPLDEFPDVMTLRQVGQALGLGMHTIRRMAGNGQLPVMEFSPKKRRVAKAVLRQRIDDGTLTGRKPAQQPCGLRVA